MQFQLHLQIHVLKVIEYIWLTVIKKLKMYSSGTGTGTGDGSGYS